MSKLYWVSTEGAGILNPGEKGFRSRDKAEALAAKAAEECSWTCLTPPAPDNELNPGKGNFMCGTLAAHGVHIRATEGGLWTEEYNVPGEKFRKAKTAQRADWMLEYVVDRNTGYLADGESYEFFTGPEPTDGYWDSLLESIAGGDEIVEATVKPTPQGRYHHLTGDSSSYPLEWSKNRGGF